MKHRIALAAVVAFVVALLGLAPLGSSQAQYGGYYPGFFGVFPPHEIVAIVRSKGLEPLSRPARQGGTYSLRATDSAGRMVQVIVDARIGRILRIAPIAPAEAMAPQPYPPPPTAERAVPDGIGPNSRIVAAPPYPDDDFEPIAGGPVPPGGVPAAARPAAPARPLPPPLPRPRPNVDALSLSASAETTPSFPELEE